MSSIQPSSGAPMPPGAAVGPVANDPAVQAQIAEVNAQLQAVNAQLGGGQPTGYAPAIDPGYIGMQGTELVESLERARMSSEADMGAAPLGLGPVTGGGPTGDAPKLSDLIEQARVRRDIDEQMAELAPVTGGGSSAGLDVQAEPYMGGASAQTGLYTGGGSMQLAGDASSAAPSEEQQLEQMLSQLSPAELAQFEAEMQAGAGAATGAGAGGPDALGAAPSGPIRS